MMDVPTISELVTSHTIRIAALESELAELRGQVNKCPTCGEYCKQCKCVESELAELRGQVHKCPACGEYCKQCKCVESELARVREQNHRLRNVLSGPGNAIVGYAQSATLLQGYANWSTALIEYADRLGEAIDRELAAEVEG